jgi:hypothetical protein
MIQNHWRISLLIGVLVLFATISRGKETLDAKALEAVQALRPSAKAPAEVPANDKTAHEHWDKLIRQYMDLPVDQVTAHPAAADFPGAVPDDAKRIVRSFDFAWNLPRWQSTGLYAPPGAKITVEVSPQDATRELAIVIGAHTDHINSHAKWPRFPVISRRFPITAARTVAANAFGGLIYIDVPRDKDLGGYHFATYGGYGWLDEHPEKVSGTIHVTIEGAVEAPLYQLGRTTPQDWKRMQELPAPWGELACDRIILTVPTSQLKKLEDPAPLLKFWSRVVNAEAELAGWPRQPAPPERIVSDREISAGFMHSGYPVMCYVSSAPGMLNLEKLTTRGDWGFFHELGHNHEGQAYTFGSDYIEVCVNLYSMYVMEKVVGREMTAHPALAHLDKVLAERLGSDHNDGPFENLAMYILPIKALGWKPLHDTLATYATSDGTSEIKTREDKMDQWVLRYSKAAGKNLAPYFAAFGITCSDQTRDAIRSLPTWLPDGFPKKYTEPQGHAAVTD